MNPVVSDHGLTYDGPSAYEDALHPADTQVLVFRVGEEWYAAPLTSVREVLAHCTPTSLPCVPDFVLGVVSLRGEVVSVSDLGRMTRLSERALDPSACPVMVLDNGECTTALVVDQLADIIAIARDRIEPSLPTADRYQTAFVTGVVELGGRIVGLLDVDRVLEPVGSASRKS